MSANRRAWQERAKMVTEGRTGSGRPKTARWNGREASVPGGGHKPHHWSWRSGEGMPICLQRPAGALPRSPFLLASTHFPRGASWQTYFTGRPSAQLPPTDRKNETTCGLAPQPQGEAPLTEAPGPGRPGFILLFGCVSVRRVEVGLDRSKAGSRWLRGRFPFFNG